MRQNSLPADDFSCARYILAAPQRSEPGHGHPRLRQRLRDRLQVRGWQLKARLSRCLPHPAGDRPTDTGQALSTRSAHPYPNSCYARDITNGSRTVFILGKEIALEDDSYFSTSEGDEAASKKLAKGIVSGAVKGRGYFQTWSPNVFVEGRAVARHMDTVSHNHLNLGNTGLFPYLSNAKERRPCDKTEKRIDKACEAKPDPDKPAPKKEKRGVLSRMFSAEPGPAYNRDWRKDHCDFLQFSAGRLSEANAKQFLEQAKQAREQIEQARQALDTLLSDYGGELLAKDGAALVEQAAWSKIRSGLYVGGGALVGAGIGVWATAAGAVPGAAIGAKGDTALAIAHSAYSAYEAALLAMDGKALFDTLTDEVRRMRDTLDTLDPLARWPATPTRTAASIHRGPIPFLPICRMRWPPPTTAPARASATWCRKAPRSTTPTAASAARPPPTAAAAPGRPAITCCPTR